MTNKPETGKLLSKSDYRYLMSLLSKAQAEAEEVIQRNGDNREARLTVRRLMRIRLALIDLDESKSKK